MYLSSYLLWELSAKVFLIALLVFVSFLLIRKIIGRIPFFSKLLVFKMLYFVSGFIVIVLLSYIITIGIFNSFAKRELSSLYNELDTYAKIKIVNSKRTDDAKAINASILEDKKIIIMLMNRIKKAKFKKFFSEGDLATQDYVEFLVYDKYSNQIKHFGIIGGNILVISNKESNTKYISSNREILSEIRSYLGSN